MQEHRFKLCILFFKKIGLRLERLKKFDGMVVYQKSLATFWVQLVYLKGQQESEREREREREREEKNERQG